MAVKSTQKSVPATDAMLAQIEKLTGAAVAASDIVIFDASAASTRAIKKPGSLFDGAVINKSTLDEMAAILNAGTQAVPLHVQHMNASMLPIGKVFQGEVVPAPDGSFDLRTLFYLPADQTDLVSSISLGVTNEVSVGLQTKQLLCSGCGYDFIGAGSDSQPLWDRICPQDHVLGQDGIHLNLSGVDLWMELSLVSRGASNQAKIMGQAQALAASGVALTATMLFATSTPLKEAPVPMDPETKAALEALTAAVAALTPLPAVVVDPALIAAQTEVEDLKVKLAAATTTDTALAELKAALTTGGLSQAADKTEEAPALVASGSFKSPKRK